MSYIKRITQQEHIKYFERLVELGVVEKSKHGEYVHTHIEQNDNDSLTRIEQLDLGDNCIWVVGYPKTGSHFVQKILENLGCNLCIGMEGDGVHIAHNPLENQDYGVKAFELLEKKTKIPSDKPYVLPHTHLPLKSFPKNIGRQKVIFIDRDPRAVAASAYHFFCEKKDNKDTVYVGPYVDLFNVTNVNQFAELFLTGNFYYGDYYKYNDEWKTQFSELHPESEILYLNFENMKSSTESNVTRIAKFIGIKDFNAAEVAEKSSFKKASKQKITKVLAKDFNQKLFRDGKSESWRNELDENMLVKYAARAELYGYIFNTLKLKSQN